MVDWAEVERCLDQNCFNTDWSRFGGPFIAELSVVYTTWEVRVMKP